MLPRDVQGNLGCVQGKCDFLGTSREEVHASHIVDLLEYRYYRYRDITGTLSNTGTICEGKGL